MGFPVLLKHVVRGGSNELGSLILGKELLHDTGIDGVTQTDPKKVIPVIPPNEDVAVLQFDVGGDAGTIGYRIQKSFKGFAGGKADVRLHQV